MVKNKQKKILRNSLIVVGVIFLLFVIAFFGFLNNIIQFGDFEEIQLSLSGTARYSGYGFPEGYIVTGEPGTNCGGRQDNSGNTMYWLCKQDVSQLDLTPFEICTSKKIQNLGNAKLTISGNAGCVSQGGSSKSCIGWLNFYDDEDNKIGSKQIRGRLFSDGFRDTLSLNDEVSIDLSMGYKDIFGENCFDIFVAGINKPEGSSGKATAKLNFNYGLNNLDLRFNAVQCESDNQCRDFESCSDDFVCEISEDFVLINETPEQTPDETLGEDCIQNIDCISTCGFDIPTCLSGRCSCEEVDEEDISMKDQTLKPDEKEFSFSEFIINNTTVVIIISLVLIFAIIFIFFGVRKKR